jgi:membrane fusion protein
MFRQEAIDHQRLRFHGSIVLARTWSHAALTALLAGCVLALVAFALLAGFSRKESVGGVIVPAGGMVQVSSPAAGVVLRLDAAEGATVRRGDALLVVSSERVDPNGPSDRSIDNAQRERAASLTSDIARLEDQARVRRAELAQRIASLGSSIELKRIELRTETDRLTAAQEIARRYPELVRSGAVSTVENMERQAAVAAQESRVAAARDTLLVLERDRRAAESHLSDLPLQLQREVAQLRRSVSEIEQQRAEASLRRTWVVQADRDGVVGAVRVTAGQGVAQGQPILDLAPSQQPLVAELFVPSRAVGFVQVGTPVQLRIDAFPFQKFGQFPGKVIEVSHSPASAAELRTFGLQTGQSTEPVYRVRVSMDLREIQANGTRLPLRAGMQLSASLVLEHRTLMEWALLPLHTLTGRL